MQQCLYGFGLRWYRVLVNSEGSVGTDDVVVGGGHIERHLDEPVIVYCNNT